MAYLEATPHRALRMVFIALAAAALLFGAWHDWGFAPPASDDAPLLQPD